jgi:large conductance mechanosensitive channel
MLKEFKEFAVRGNVVDMAVGIIIGGAFTGVVKTLVDEIVMPPIGLLTGSMDASDKFLLLNEGKTPPPYATLKAAKESGAVVVGYGSLINAVFSLFLVALVLFFVVKWINSLRTAPPAAAPTTKPCPYCVSPVDLKATRCPHCTSQLEAVSGAT